MEEAELFEPEALSARLPEEAQRYFSHAIQRGSPLARKVEISFHGQVCLKPGGRWQAFRATEQIHMDRSFKLTSLSHLGPMPMRLLDQYRPDQASAQRLLFGRIPIKTQRGPDLNRAAHSRVMLDSAWLPTAFLPQHGARWFKKDGALRLEAKIAEDRVELTPQLGPEGGLQEVYCLRWSNLTEGGGYAWVPFSSLMQAEKTFEG